MAENSCVSSAPGYSQKYWPHWQTHQIIFITKKLYLLFQNMKDILERIVVWAANQDIPQNIDHTEEQTTHPPNKECLSTHIEQSQSSLTLLFFFVWNCSKNKYSPILYIVSNIVRKVGVKNCFDPICKCGTKSKDFIKVHNYFWGIVHNFLGRKFKQLRWITAFAAVRLKIETQMKSGTNSKPTKTSILALILRATF